MGEFDLIRRIFQPLADATASPLLPLGLGDDCAVQIVRPGTELAFSIDTLVEGVHFPVNYNPAFLGWRSLAVATSDLAAMGADPVCFTLALTLPDAEPDWLRGFADGLREAALAFGLALAGGDTTRGPLTISIQVHGTVPAGQALTRAGARVGDLVCVSGTLGDAAAALSWLDNDSESADVQWLLSRYHRPQPRLALGQALRGRATAAIDLSDGLSADLQHILTAAGVGARIDLRKLPLSDALKQNARDRAVDLALSGGDDYELCFTLPPSDWPEINRAGVADRLTVIGEVLSSPGLWCTGELGDRQLTAGGYDHFGGEA
ncbi:MAG: thiamine-phosphate kinase [Marinobacter sp.]|nr:thiamine-phosphate kinase [Marinobacter sp.]